MSDFANWLGAAPRPKLGLWQALATPYTAEICARAGFDWLLFDGEHAPNSLPALLGQLQAVTNTGVHPIGRIPIGDPVQVKQYLDIGFPTLLVPMVDTAAQARMLVDATRFPPRGTRGVASATSRASAFGADTRYLAEAHERVGLIVQIESAAALANVAAIAATDGVSGVFIGPGDLAGSLGHLGNPRHREVQAAIESARSQIVAVGKPVGIFALDVADARDKAAQGYDFISVGTDIGLLASGARTLLSSLSTTNNEAGR